MSDARPPARRRSPGLGQGASTQMAKTAGLVLVAIIIGVILLNVIDDGSTSSANKTTTPTTKKPTTSTTHPGSQSTTSTTKPAPQLTPAQLRIIVLNAGSGINKGASSLSDELRTKGYTNQGTPGNTSTVSGVLVECRAGLDREAAALATATGHGAKVAAFPATPPAGVDQSINCMVLRGKSSSSTSSTT